MIYKLPESLRIVQALVRIGVYVVYYEPKIMLPGNVDTMAIFSIFNGKVLQNSLEKGKRLAKRFSYLLPKMC